MTFRIFLSIAIGLLLLVVGYVVGYTRSHRAFLHNETVFDLQHNLMLYSLVKQGDTNRLEGKLRFSIYSYSAYYDQNFGDWTVTDKCLIRNLTQARAIANQERTNIVFFSNSHSLLQLIKERMETNRPRP